MTALAHSADTLLPGFSNPVHDAQRSFRSVLDAMARPAHCRTLPEPAGIPDGWTPALTALALTLFDQDTPVWLDPAVASRQAEAYLRFHCGCPLTDRKDRAAFAVIADMENAPPLHAFPIGEPQYPERSVTLIYAIESLTGGTALRWQGPGIKGSIEAAPKGLPAGFIRQWADNHALYPSGVDVILTAGSQVMCLPRSISIEEA